MYLWGTKQKNMTLAAITNQMNALEITIARQQQYIAKHGTVNDANTDSAWETYKQDAAYNLEKWDNMKSLRDNLKN